MKKRRVCTIYVHLIALVLTTKLTTSNSVVCFVLLGFSTVLVWHTKTSDLHLFTMDKYLMERQRHFCYEPFLQWL